MVYCVGMKDLPDSTDTLVVRTDFSDEVAWALVRSEMDWSDFADSVDADGVFRGFPDA